MPIDLQIFRRFYPWIALLLLGLVVFWAYGPVLGFYMTDIDTWPLILTGRVENLHDFFAHFGRELLAGRMINARYYRPVLSLSYGLDYSLWGTNPFGYHLTDLFLHWANAVGVYLLCRQWLGREAQWTSVLAGLAFALHPIHIENVPAIARRAELLMGLFLWTSLWCHIRSWRVPRWRTLALFLFLTGLFVKESMVTFPLVIAATALLRHPPQRGRDLVRVAVLEAWPYAILTVIFVGIRTVVLGGMGGYSQAQALWINLISNVAGQPLGLFFGGLAPDWINLLDHHFKEMALWTARICLTVGLLILPWKFSWFNSTDRRLFTHQRLLVFCAVWLVAHAVLLVAFGFNFRYLYPEIFPFSIAFAVGLTQMPQLACASAQSTRGKRWAALIALVILTVVLSDYASSFLNRKGLEQWRDDAQRAENIAAQLTAMAADKPVGSTFFLVNFPYQAIVHPWAKILSMPLSVITLEHALQAYVDLHLPAQKAKMVGLSYVYHYIDVQAPHYKLQPLEATTSFDPPDQIAVQVVQGGLPTGQPWEEAYGPRHRGRYYETTKTSPDRVLIKLSEEALAQQPKFFVVYDGSDTLQTLSDPFGEKTP